MQYELAKLMLPLVIVAGGYDSDPASVAECRDIIEIREKVENENSISWLVGIMGGGRHSGHPIARCRKASPSLILSIHNRRR